MVWGYVHACVCIRVCVVICMHVCAGMQDHNGQVCVSLSASVFLSMHTTTKVRACGGGGWVGWGGRLLPL